MSFLGMGTFEILVILLVAFIFLGPERMVDAARILGKWTGELRRMGSTVQAEMDDLANVNAPLSSRYAQADNTVNQNQNASPLDQDHPSEPSGSVASIESDGMRHDSKSGTPSVGAQSHAPDSQSTKREENA